MKLSRDNVIDWFVSVSPDKLKPNQLKQLAAKFRDDEQYLKDLLREIKAAKSNGTQLSLQHLLKDENNGESK